MQKQLSISQRNKQAEEAEENGDIPKAISLYTQNINDGFADPVSFERLMILHRKTKNYKEELEIIRKGIEAFKMEAKRSLEENISTKKNKAQLTRLSNAFMKGSGLIDKKGNEVHLPEPINKWMKRMVVVEKKLKPAKRK